jgi:hypothetical protein
MAIPPPAASGEGRQPGAAPTGGADDGFRGGALDAIPELAAGAESLIQAAGAEAANRSTSSWPVNDGTLPIRLVSPPGSPST